MLSTPSARRVIARSEASAERRGNLAKSLGTGGRDRHACCLARTDERWLTMTEGEDCFAGWLAMTGGRDCHAGWLAMTDERWLTMT